MDFTAIYGIKAYFDYDWALECAKQKKKPLFVYFTGWGCVSDRSYEKYYFDNDSVKELLAKEFIPVFLYVDDKSKLPASDYFETEDGNTVKTIGKKYAYLQRNKFERVAQPYCVILDYDETKLSEIGYIESNKTERFGAFLQGGLIEFQRKNNL